MPAPARRTATAWAAMHRMLRHTLLPLTLLFAWVPPMAQAQRPGYPPELPGARVEVYRSVGDVELNAWVYEPAGQGVGDARPAIVFFFGGGWNAGSPGQFRPQAEHLARRGMVAILVDYRVRSRHDTLVTAAVSDAMAALSWVRAEAARLGVDPGRVAAAGGSAGGHLAAATAMLPAPEAGAQGPRASAVPDALVLFNPVLITAPVPGQAPEQVEKIARLAPRLGAEPKSLSPYHHVRPGLPPTLVLHGEDDAIVPYEHARLFAEAMNAAGNRCELIGYPGEGHGFFNAHRKGGSAYDDTVRSMDEFLTSLGWLQPSAGTFEPATP